VGLPNEAVENRQLHISAARPWKNGFQKCPQIDDRMAGTETPYQESVSFASRDLSTASTVEFSGAAA